MLQVNREEILRSAKIVIVIQEKMDSFLARRRSSSGSSQERLVSEVQRTDVILMFVLLIGLHQRC